MPISTFRYRNNQKISEISCRGSDIPIQGSALWSVHSTLGIHCGSKGGKTDGHTQGYKDPPIPRRLVSESQILPGLSPAYADPIRNLPKVRLASEHGQVGTGTEASLRFCRLPVRPQSRLGPTNSRQVAEPSIETMGNIVTTGLSGPAVHVPDWFTNSHGEESSPRSATHETHTVASQISLENTRVTGKGDHNSQISAPSFTMVATRRQRSHRPTMTPNKTCSANLYRRIKRRLGRSLKRAHCQRYLVTARKQTAYKLFGTQGSVSRPQIVPKLLYKPDGTCGNRQHYSDVVHKQRRRHEVGPSLCPIMENLELVYQTSSNSKSSAHSGMAKRGSRQALPFRTDHSDRMVPPSRGVSSYMPQMAPTSDRSICHEVQPQVTSLRITSTGPLGSSSGCTQSPLGGSGRIRFPPAASLGKVVERLQDYPCRRIILIAPGWPNMPWFWDLVTMSSQIPLSLPNLPNLLTQPFNQIPHRNLTNLNLHTWLLEPQQLKSRVSLKRWQQELRLLREDQPDPSMRQSGPFLQSGASLIRWTSGHPL